MICGQQLPNPLEDGADILQGNTHKSLPGPQKGLFHIRDESAAELIRSGLSRGLVSSSHFHHMLALFFTLLETKENGQAYAALAIANAQALGQSLLASGVDLVRDENGVFTESHVILAKFNSNNEAHTATRRLHNAGIASNARMAFGSPVIRIGTQEIARIGIQPDTAAHIGEIMARVILGKSNDDGIHLEIQKIMLEHRFR